MNTQKVRRGRCPHRSVTRIISLILSFAMLLTLTAGLDFSALANISGDYEYTVLEDGTAEITKYIGNDKEIIIPFKMDGYTVTKIGVSAFSECTNLINIVFSKSITTIAHNAFYHCDNLKYVTLSNSLVSIDDYAFAYCNLLNVVLPDTVLFIGTHAFHYCGISEIIVPKNVEQIGVGAFGCLNLKTIIVDKDNKNFISQNNVLFNFDKTVLYQYPAGSIQSSYIIPNSVKCIKNEAFRDCQNLVNVSMSSNVILFEGYDTFHNDKNLKEFYYHGTEKDFKTIQNRLNLPNWTKIYYVEHVWNNGVITKPATCTESGVKTYTCTVCGTTKTETIDKTNHTVVIDKAVEPTCTTPGKTEGSHCSVCNTVIVKQEVIPAKGHTAVTDKALAPTCTKSGLTEGSHCSVCGEIIVKQNAVNATGHKWDNGVITKPATCTESGVKTYTCTVCGETKTEPIEKLNHTVKWQSVNGLLVKICTVCSEEISRLQFEDLGDYVIYADYVEYTSSFNKFIAGTNPPEYTKFSPTTPITRAMFVAILYRMAGNPYENGNNPHSSNPFSDVNPSAYYYNAACWALDEGITNQITFKPNDNVTREQTARFLFAYAEANDMLGDEEYLNTDISDYPDYDSVHSWAVEPLQWANYNDMITGTSQGYINPQGATQRIHATRILYGFGKVCNIGNFE